LSPISKPASCSHVSHVEEKDGNSGLFQAKSHSHASIDGFHPETAASQWRIIQFSPSVQRLQCKFRFVLEQNSIADAVLSSFVGLSCWNVQEASLFGWNSRVAKEDEGTKIGGRFSFNFTSSKVMMQTRFVLWKNSIAGTMVSFHIGLSCWNVQKASLLGWNSRVAEEVEGTKIGGRFSFNFTSSKGAMQTRFVLWNNSIAGTMVSFCVGSSCWNVQKASLFCWSFDDRNGVVQLSKLAGLGFHFTSWDAKTAETRFVAVRDSITDTLVSFCIGSNC
jgi:hypothetical protein